LFVAGAAAILFGWNARFLRRRAGPVESPVPLSTKSTVPEATTEHAVILHLPLSAAGFGAKGDVAVCQEIEDDLEQEIVAGGVGEMDGNEIGGGECTLFMYGPDADKLFARIVSRARSSRFGKGGWAIKRYGPAEDPRSREVRVDL